MLKRRRFCPWSRRCPSCTRGPAWSKLYGEQKLEPPPSLHDAETLPLNYSVAKIRIF